MPRSEEDRGVALLYKQSLTVKQQKVAAISFEAMEVLITAGNEVVWLFVIYRPPSGGKVGQPASVFFDKFHRFIDGHATTSCKLIVVGDFNFHMDITANKDSVKLRDTLECLILEQHVQEPTHTRGHILDLVITCCSELSVNCLKVGAPVVSDHGEIIFSLPLGKPPTSYKTCIS